MQIKIHAQTIEQANILYDILEGTCIDMIPVTIGYDTMLSQAYIILEPRKGYNDVNT